MKRRKSMNNIGHSLCKRAASIVGVVRRKSEFAPPLRRRPYLPLTLAERKDISRGNALNWSIRMIATKIRKSAGDRFSRRALQAFQAWKTSRNSRQITSWMCGSAN